MLKPKSLFAEVNQYVNKIVAAFLFIVVLVVLRQSSSSSSSESKLESSSLSAPVKDLPVRIHEINTFVPAIAFSGVLRKPLEIVDSQISCPEQGGKNLQCGKASAEYRFKVKEAGDYYLYIQVTAPGLNDNSLWISLVEGADEDAFDGCETPDGEDTWPLIPHKHLGKTNQFLCCPAYLAKNKKKGLPGFYSDCCYSALGSKSNQKGCVLDLEVDNQLRWNEVPRVFRTTEPNQVVVIRVYAREDGTSWSGLVLGSKSTLDNRAVGWYKKSTVE